MHTKNLLPVTLLVFLIAQPISAGAVSDQSLTEAPAVEPDGIIDEEIVSEIVSEIAGEIAKEAETPAGINGAALDQEAPEETIPGASPAIIPENPQSAANGTVADDGSASPAVGQEEPARSMIPFIVSALFIIALLVVLFMRRGRGPDTQALGAEAYLNDIGGCTTRGSHKLGGKPVMVGRAAGQDHAHLDYLVIPESTVGRRHALIEYKDFGFWVRDQGSINGTFVNDKMLKKETRLKHGDKVRFHKFRFEFVMPEMGDGATVVSHEAIPAEVLAEAMAEVGRSSPDASANPGEGFFDISGSVEEKREAKGETQGLGTPEAPASGTEPLMPETTADETLLPMDQNDDKFAGDDGVPPPGDGLGDDSEDAGEETLLPAGSVEDELYDPLEEEEDRDLLPGDALPGGIDEESEAEAEKEPESQDDFAGIFGGDDQKEK